MTIQSARAEQVRPTLSMICPCLAVETLAVLSWSVRVQAYADFDDALANWRQARRARANGDWCWRLDMRRALRFWKHYADAVRRANERRIAA